MRTPLRPALGCSLLLACSGADDPIAATHAPPQGSPDPPRDPWQPGAPTTGATDSESTAAPASSTTTGDATTTSTTGPAPDPDTTDTSTTTPSTCGDGTVQPPEQCDDTYADNADDAACTQSCQLNVCGDGLVHAGVEQCDEADANNDTTFDGCKTDCTLGPRCGDAILQPDHEECDGPPTEGQAPCIAATCKFAGRLAFVTSTKLQGDFGGLAHADEICTTAAATAGLDNAQQFKAWLSDGNKTAIQRLPDAAADPAPIVRRGGMLLADDLADLIAHGPNVPLDVDEFNNTLPPEQPVWTNLDLAGEPFSAVNHCKEWTDASFSATAMTGQASPESDADLLAWHAGFLWTSDAPIPCKYNAHFYCFED